MEDETAILEITNFELPAAVITIEELNLEGLVCCTDCSSVRTVQILSTGRTGVGLVKGWIDVVIPEPTEVLIRICSDGNI